MGNVERLRTDDEWADYIGDAQRGSVNAILETGKRWKEYADNCKRIYGKQGGSHFSEFAREYFGMSAAAASHWAKIGEKEKELCSIATKFSLPQDWSAIYMLTTVDDMAEALEQWTGGNLREHVKSLKSRNNLSPPKAKSVHNQIIVGDFRDHFDKITDESVDLIFTDPPYHRKHLGLYDGLGDLADAKLKDGGSLITYLGDYAIHEISEKLTTDRLRFVWTLVVKLDGSTACLRQGFAKGLQVRHKCLLWFGKGKTRIVDQTFKSLVDYPREKSHHDWQQSISEASYWIEKLTNPDGFVVDPFCGGGTTPLACKQLGRSWLSFEIDKDTAKIATKRINDAIQ